MKLVKDILVFLTLLVCMISNAQDLAYAGNPDTSYFTARDLAFSGHRTTARDTLNRILTKYPEYTDVRSLLAKTLSWDGKYDDARKEFNRITSKERENKEAWIAAVKNELYAKEYHIALGLANKGLAYLENDVDLLELKAKSTSEIEAKENNPEEIRKQLNRITSAEPENRDAWVAAVKNEIHAKEYYIALGLANKALQYFESDDDLLTMKAYATLKINQSQDKNVDTNKELANVESENLEDDTAPKKNQLVLTNAFDVFDQVFETMIYTSLEYKRETGAGAIIPRINYNNRFQTHGLQYELDFYPKFSKTFYGYLNYGYSASPIFPDHRVGGELYANLPNKLELSAGFRFLDFASTKATIYTGSVGLYSGNYYFSLRPYVTPSPNGNMGVSGTLLARKYLKNADSYIGFRAAVGFNPELRQLRDGEDILAETLLYVESQQLLLEYQFTGWLDSNSYRTNLGVTRQEFIFDSNNFFWAVSAGLTCQVKF